ncbi:Sec-independent protein translocase protein TatB [Falsiroseomonas selenitidurans]|uniref:Sec-independent protein translocase protein TatB n=1 Tax=Falsiroseomonas selenitidurans TaxID=2716335 RepID=A0ABX1EBS0_9PROT|nr:Sec-independent protein translocase protein TatB [Falsiroseomonas selenitidurans]NKC34451.1 twin-arginine translocase subunit TatB [Falsiroseomonas selenitidurans]OYW09343.1 MAG: twin arginine-targeting protein translocase TatB [Rhodospirillales bacterium 12-71-4]
MLGLDWSELALIAVVAVVVIGPKDLPDAVRGVAKFIQKLRRMAGEFQGQVDEVVREAKLEDVRNQISEIRNFNVRDIVEKEIDKDGSIRKTFTEDPIGNPLRDSFSTTPPPVHGAEVTPPPAEAAAGLAEGAFGPPVPDTSSAPAAPAFVPPSVVASQAPPAPPAAPAMPPSSPPAFVPPPGSSAGTAS